MRLCEKRRGYPDSLKRNMEAAGEDSSKTRCSLVLKLALQVKGFHEARTKSKRKDVGTGSLSKNAYDGSEFWTEDGRT